MYTNPFACNLDNALYASVKEKAATDCENMSLFKQITGDTKVYKRMPLVLYERKIKQAIKKLERIDGDVASLIADLKTVRAALKSHPRYEKQRDRYELQQMVKTGPFTFVKTAFSVAMKLV